MQKLFKKLVWHIKQQTSGWRILSEEKIRISNYELNNQEDIMILNDNNNLKCIYLIPQFPNT